MMTLTKTSTWYAVAVLCVAAFGFGLVGCGEEEPADTTIANPRPDAVRDAMRGGAAAVSDAAQAAAEDLTSKIKVCVVSGEKLESMGDVVKYTHEGRVIPFCCKDCIEKFKKEPAKYLAKIDALLKE